MITFENKNAATVQVAEGQNPRELYPHQKEAMQRLNDIDKNDEFNSLLVLPTGAGKTLTAVYWLLKNAVNKRKKILWVAHRHLLLDQAAETFVLNGYSDLLTNRMSYRYRIISGIHDKPIHIDGSEDILICGKDSIIKNTSALGNWMGNDDIYLVIDEAHHAVARSYQTIINYVKNTANRRSAHIKLLGLTATPYRTDENEKAALGKIFTDDIVYSVDLDTLIKNGILSTPICKTYETHILAGKKLSNEIVKKISFSDNIPEDLANDIAENSERNHLIVKKYLENRTDYLKTIVFALNIRHAIELNTVFQKNGVRSEYIVSNIKDAVTGISRSKEENAKNIEAYKNGELDVLINVNILTEGTDLPQTKTVFLTRPTISRVLMTQMVGRALRGEKAGGTKTAYIISFIDNWEDKITFASPESILIEGTVPEQQEHEYKRRDMRYIAISLIEEFARIADDTVDTSRLENLPFSERIPLGMYMVSYMEEDTVNEVSIERNYSVLVYNSSQEAYRSFLNDIEQLLKEYSIEGDYIDSTVTDKLVPACRERYFKNVILPPCKDADIEALLKYYAYTGKQPPFIPIDEISRSKVNISYIAQDILDLRLDDFSKREYLEDLWNNDQTLLKLFYTEFEYFIRQLDKEIYKIVYGVRSAATPNTIYENVELEKLPLQKIIERDPQFGMKIKNDVFKAAEKNGMYKCCGCGMTSPYRKDFQIDHIKPMSKGGLTVRENLQLLCRRCNGIKSDHEDDLPLAYKDLSKPELPEVIRSEKYVRFRLGGVEKMFTLTPGRIKSNYISFHIGVFQYKYHIDTDKIEII